MMSEEYNKLKEEAQHRETWNHWRAENLKKKSLKIPKNNYAATMVSAARRQNIGGGGGAPTHQNPRRRGPPMVCCRRRRRPQIVGGGGAARPAHGSTSNTDSSHGSTELCCLWPNTMELAAGRT